MKALSGILAPVILMLTISCHQAENRGDTEPLDQKVQQTVLHVLDTILTSKQVEGAILIYDHSANIFYSNDFEHCSEQFLPASTFKIPNSIIALETGVVDADTSIFCWNGEKRAYKAWEQDLDLRDAFQYSCVPVYQEIARKIGAERMNNYLKNLDYGSMDVHENNIDVFWLEGNSVISQFEQIDFLKRLYFEELSIAKKTTATLKEILLLEEDEHTKFSGKTGWVMRNGENTGWFVGYYETNGKVWFVATNIQPKESFNMDYFPVIRKEISHTAIQLVLTEINEYRHFEF